MPFKWILLKFHREVMKGTEAVGPSWAQMSLNAFILKRTVDRSVIANKSPGDADDVGLWTTF